VGGDPLDGLRRHPLDAHERHAPRVGGDRRRGRDRGAVVRGDARPAGPRRRL